MSEAFFQSFRRGVLYFRTAIQIRFGKRAKQFSVRLEPAVKLTIHHHTNQIRAILLPLDLPQAKKESLLDKLAAFENEVDRDRTRFEAFGAAVVALGGILGDAADKAEPLRKWIDSVADLIWGAKDEELKQLPSPPERKRIEPPKKETQVTNVPDFSDEIDDEIPF